MHVGGEQGLDLRVPGLADVALELRHPRGIVGRGRRALRASRGSARAAASAGLSSRAFSVRGRRAGHVALLLQDRSERALGLGRVGPELDRVPQLRGRALEVALLERRAPLQRGPGSRSCCGRRRSRARGPSAARTSLPPCGRRGPARGRADSAPRRSRAARRVASCSSFTASATLPSRRYALPSATRARANVGSSSITFWSCSISFAGPRAGLAP